MSVLGDLRTTVRDHLAAAELTAYLMKPERFAPPAVFIGPGDPYITRADASFGGETIRLLVTAVVASGTNEKRAAELDELVLDLLDALYALEEFGVGDVQQPGQISINGEPHLATAIEIAAEIHR